MNHLHSQRKCEYVNIHFQQTMDKYKLNKNGFSLLLTNHEGLLLSEFLVIEGTCCNNNKYILSR